MTAMVVLLAVAPTVAFSVVMVPACVAVISYLDLIRKDWLSITVATLASTFLVLFVTGKVHELMRRYW